MGLGLFYNDTVTLYNKYLDKTTGREKWKATLLENVNLVITKGANITKSGMQDADAAKLFVDFNNMPKPYMESVSWKELSDDDKEQCFTFTSTEDFFCEGDTTDIPITEKDFYGWMKKHWDNVFKVTNIDRYADILPHFEVGGK